MDAQIGDPLNAAFDGRFHRLLILQAPGARLLSLPEDAPSRLGWASYDATPFGVKNPQGLAVDPASGALFMLDASGPRIVRIQPAADGSLNGASIEVVSLEQSGILAPRSLAFHAATGHLFLIDTAGQNLYELSQTGQTVVVRDLSPFALNRPQGMVFAPSSDQTDSPSDLNLYVADASAGEGLAAGQIAEFSLKEPVSLQAAATFTSTLIRTVDAAQWNPPSPDPDGVTYLPLSNTLLISDPEVEETVNRITHFAGANLWETALDGNNAEIYPYTVAGALVSHFDVGSMGVQDPEGVEFNRNTVRCPC